MGSAHGPPPCVKIARRRKINNCPGQFSHNNRVWQFSPENVYPPSDFTRKRVSFLKHGNLLGERFFGRNCAPNWVLGLETIKNGFLVKKKDTIGSFFIENGATGARFVNKTCFLVLPGAAFQFSDKIVAGLEIKKPPGQSS